MALSYQAPNLLTQIQPSGEFPPKTLTQKGENNEKKKQQNNRIFKR